MSQIKLGLPKGSLNRKDRGNTCELFVNAGYDIQGYEPERESERLLDVLSDSTIAPFLVRPQSAPYELRNGMIDIAIIGEDWVQDAVFGGTKGITKIGDLGYGQIKIVAAVSEDAPYKTLSDLFLSHQNGEPVLCFTEYVYLTREHFMRNEGYKAVYGDKKPVAEVRGLRDGENGLVAILNSDGLTEGYIRKGADIIVDNSHTGTTLREYRLKVLEEFMSSCAGLYAGPTCIGWKGEKAWEVYERLGKAANF